MLKKTRKFIACLLREEDGPTTTEYAILLSLIIMIAFLSIKAVGIPVNQMWEQSGTEMNTAITSND